MNTKIPAYKGTEPYIFVSYSHKDSEDVMKDIAWMNENRYRVWYDEGIEFGRDFPEELALAIKNCEQFVACLSKNAVESEYVNKEISYALKQQKSVLPIMFENTRISERLEFLLSTTQYLGRNMNSWSDYCEYLEKGLHNECKDIKNPPKPPRPDTKCKKCGEILTDGAKFCDKCGYAIAAPLKQICPKCKSQVSGSLLFCGKCGARLIMNPFPHPVEPDIITRKIQVSRDPQFVCMANRYRIFVNGNDLGCISVGKTISANVNSDTVTVDIVCATIMINSKIRMLLQLQDNPRVSFQVEWPGTIKATVYNAKILQKTNNF